MAGVATGASPARLMATVLAWKPICKICWNLFLEILTDMQRAGSRRRAKLLTENTFLSAVWILLVFYAGLADWQSPVWPPDRASAKQHRTGQKKKHNGGISER